MVHLQVPRTLLWLVVGWVDLERWLAGEVHPPEATAPARARRLGAALEHAEHRLGPQVLVEVDGLHDGDHSLFCIKLVENMGFGLDCGSPQLSGALWVVPIITRRPTAPERGPECNRITRLLSMLALGAVALTLAGCVPLASPGKTGQIEFVASSTSGGWKWDHYRNLAYPCSINGYQTFVIGTKVGSSNTESRPLWVRMRGGGVGFFDANGDPQPSAGNKSEETAATSIGFVNNNALTGLVRADAAGFRIVSVSMCNHDIYSGGDQTDPNNPNTTPDGEPRTVNGLFATKAAIAFAKEQYPTGKVILHGTSAGSAGVYYVAYGMQEEGVSPAGAIADSGSVNRQWEIARAEQNTAVTTRTGGRSTRSPLVCTRASRGRRTSPTS